MVQKVGIIKGQSQYDVMRTWSIELEKGFNKIGIETVVYDFKHHSNFNHHSDIDFYVAFNGWTIGYQDALNFNKPVIMVLADHVTDHLERIKSLREKDILTVMDKHDDTILNLIGMERELYFLPHAALEVCQVEEEKHIDCLFLGSYSNPDGYLQELNKLENDQLKKIFEEIIQECLSTNILNYLEFSIQKFRDINVEISVEKNAFLIEIIRIVGRYLYSLRRINVIREIADSGITVHIFGNGWEQSDLYYHKNIVFSEAKNFYESQKLIEQSKILINVQSLLVDGTHERVFAAMANNSVSLSNRTKYLSEEFIEDEEIIFFDFDNLTNVIGKIKDLLKDEIVRKTIVSKAKKKVFKDHTYQKRAEHLIGIYNYHIENTVVQSR